MRFAPIEQWPGAPTPLADRRHARFRSPHARTLRILDYELDKLDAQNVVLQAYISPDQIRLDGWLRGRAAPHDPGVILSFTSKAGAVSFPCDTYKDYMDNLHAIALSLVALRAVDRYGVTRNNEQYRGWAKLPPAAARMAVPDALAFVTLHAGMPAAAGAEGFRKALRRAQMKLHPDNPQTGNAGQFHMLQQAQKVVEEAYGW
jgi:hypothetical protein